MKRLLLAAIVAMAASGRAWAQSSMTGTGMGLATSTSSSQAISGQGGTGVGVAAITTNSTVPADQTVKNVPSVVAPGLAAAGLETCLGSISGGGAFVGTGFSFGTTIPDPGCAARLDARTLWSMGLKKAAVARLCLNPEIYRAMPEVWRLRGSHDSLVQIPTHQIGIACQLRDHFSVWRSFVWNAALAKGLT